MIDWVTAKLPCRHRPLQTGRVCRITPDGEVAWEVSCLQSVEGSYESKMAVKSGRELDGQGMANYLWFSGNPSKFLQGHNVFGSDDLLALVYDSYLRICRILALCPGISNLRDVKSGRYRCEMIHINYSYALPCRADVLAWLRAMEFKSKTRHGRPSSKGGTLYWGKESKRWALKAYCKGEEIERRDKYALPVELRDTPIPAWADNKLRLELVLKGKELDELGLSQASSLNTETIARLYYEYIRRLDMCEQIRLTDHVLMNLPKRLRSTYVLWQSGDDLRSILPKATYYRHRKELLAYGINIDLRQHDFSGSNVVPLLRANVLEAVPAEVPDWAFDMGLVHSSARRAVAC